MQNKLTLKDLTFSSLTKRGFDGLFSDDGECACKLTDLMSCHAPKVDCAAGYVSEGREDDVQNGGLTGYWIGLSNLKN
jgi:hypothetical protein